MRGPTFAVPGSAHHFFRQTDRWVIHTRQAEGILQTNHLFGDTAGTGLEFPCVPGRAGILTDLLFYNFRAWFDGLLRIFSLAR